MIKTLLIIYGAVAALVFVGSEIFMLKCIYELKKEEEIYQEYDQHEGLGCVALVVSLIIGIMWPVVPLLLLGVWFTEMMMQKHPGIMGLEENEGGGEDGS